MQLSSAVFIPHFQLLKAWNCTVLLKVKMLHKMRSEYFCPFNISYQDSGVKTHPNKTHSYGFQSLSNKVSTLSFISMAHKICGDGAHFGLRADKVLFYLFPKIRTYFLKGVCWRLKTFKRPPFIRILFYFLTAGQANEGGIQNKLKCYEIRKKGGIES